MYAENIIIHIVSFLGFVALLVIYYGQRQKISQLRLFIQSLRPGSSQETVQSPSQLIGIMCSELGININRTSQQNTVERLVQIKPLINFLTHFPYDQLTMSIQGESITLECAKLTIDHKLRSELQAMNISIRETP